MGTDLGMVKPNNICRSPNSLTTISTCEVRVMVVISKAQWMEVRQWTLGFWIRPLLSICIRQVSNQAEDTSTRKALTLTECWNLPTSLKKQLRKRRTLKRSTGGPKRIKTTRPRTPESTWLLKSQNRWQGRGSKGVDVRHLHLFWLASSYTWSV